jgi:hypothetical protein
MRALFVIVLAPILYLFPGVRKAQEPMGVQAFNPKPPVESFDESMSRFNTTETKLAA